jgi:hypothetical protein
MAGGKRWTAAEDQILRLHYGGWTLRRLARVLSRPEYSCQFRASRLGLVRPRPDRGKEVAELYALGLPDPLIARKLGVARSWVGHLRRQLGLGPPHPAPHHGTYHALMGRQNARHAWQAQAELLWPGCRASPTEAALLSRLEGVGEARTGDLADLSRDAYQHLGRLRRRGLVRIARRLCTRHGRAPVWALDGPAMAAAQRRKQRGDLR